MKRTSILDFPPDYQLSTEKRLWAQVDKTESCWLWTAFKNHDGYGKIGIGREKAFAHRVSYELAKGRIPLELQLDHLCRNRACVNPDHLEVVSCKENLNRGIGLASRHSRHTHCYRGHPLEGSNLDASPLRQGIRVCKTCKVEDARIHSLERAALLEKNEVLRAEATNAAFWGKVEKTDGCWLWKGGTTSGGYGGLHPSRTEKILAHRFAYEQLVGPIPKGLVIDHLCRNRLCVNPAHLEVVTHRVNILRGVGMAAIRARKTHCPKGHPYSEENTGHDHTSNRRYCKTCRRERSLSRRKPSPTMTETEGSK